MHTRHEMTEEERESFFGSMENSGPNPWGIQEVRTWKVFEDGKLRCGFRVEGEDILFFFTHIHNDNPHRDRLQEMIDSGATQKEMREVRPASMERRQLHSLPVEFKHVLKSTKDAFFQGDADQKFIPEMETWWLRAKGAANHVLQRNKLTLGVLEHVSEQAAHLPFVRS